MTKPPFSCLCTTPAPTLTAVIILNLLFPERTGKREEMKWRSRIGGGTRQEGKGEKNHKKLIVWMKRIKAVSCRLQLGSLYKTARLCLNFSLKSEQICFYR